MIDTHCHIDLYNEPEKILLECEKADMTVLAMTNLPSHFQMGHPHVLPFKKIRLALGMHPLYVQEHIKEFPLFVKNLPKTSYVGEVGLDFSREGYATKEMQVASFKKILRLLNGERKVLSLHSRRAEKEVLDLLIDNDIKTAIFHWYSGPLALIDGIVQQGYYFSINPDMLTSENGKKIIGRIPAEKILTETDGPFTQVNGRPVRPTDVDLVYRYLAEIWGKTRSEVEDMVAKNFRALISNLK